ETRRVVLGAVDPETGRQTLQGRGKLATGHREVALRIQRHHAGVDDLCHCLSPVEEFDGPPCGVHSASIRRRQEMYRRGWWEVLGLVALGPAVWEAVVRIAPRMSR